MSQPARHLRVVDQDGVAQDLDAYVQQLEDQLAGAEKDIAAWRTRYFNLKRDKDLEAREHELFPTVAELFDLWRELCRHPRSAFTPDRFWMALPYVENPKYGVEACRLAIRGLAFDPYITRRKNGTMKRHDGWHLIFDRGADKFEECCNKAPINKGGSNDDDSNGGGG